MFKDVENSSTLLEPLSLIKIILRSKLEESLNYINLKAEEKTLNESLTVWSNETITEPNLDNKDLALLSVGGIGLISAFLKPMEEKAFLKPVLITDGILLIALPIFLLSCSKDNKNENSQRKITKTFKKPANKKSLTDNK